MKVIPCGHIFHSACIDYRLSRDPHCPKCNKLVPGAKPDWLLGGNTLLTEEAEEVLETDPKFDEEFLKLREDELFPEFEPLESCMTQAHKVTTEKEISGS